MKFFFLCVCVKMSLLRLRTPLRALKPPASSQFQASPPPSDEDEKKTVPFIPREFAKDTIEFFRQSSPHVKSLLDLVFSAKEQAPSLSAEDQAEREAKTAEYLGKVEEARKKYRQHELRARRKMFEAIRHLPSDLYEEAVSKGDMFPPASLQFHQKYKDQLKSRLTDWELVQMQTFANLMHIRYSHSEAKVKHRDRFFISESAALNLRKERAKKEKTGNSK